MKEKTPNKFNIKEDPVTIPGSSGDEKITQHPAFAQVNASRVAGGTYLYGSGFKHQNFISLKVSHSEEHRSLSRSWYFPRKEVVEVWMSESQWASLVSSLNSGSGTPATLRHIQGDPVPMLPEPKNVAHTFDAEAKKALEEALTAILDLKVGLLTCGLSLKKTEGLTSKADRATMRLTNALPFVMEQFGEHMESEVSSAKSELEAYILQLQSNAGLPIKGGAFLEGPAQEEDE